MHVCITCVRICFVCLFSDCSLTGHHLHRLCYWYNYLGGTCWEGIHTMWYCLFSGFILSLQEQSKRTPRQGCVSVICEIVLAVFGKLGSDSRAFGAGGYAVDLWTDLCWHNFYQQTFSKWNTSESTNNEAFVRSIQWAAPGSVNNNNQDLNAPKLEMHCVRWLRLGVGGCVCRTDTADGEGLVLES